MGYQYYNIDMLEQSVEFPRLLLIAQSKMPQFDGGLEFTKLCDLGLCGDIDL